MREKLSDLFEDVAATREQRSGAMVPPIYVSTPQYDDMGSVLDRLGFAYEPLASVDIARLDNAVVMINCGCGGYDEKARALDPFLKRGGSAIGSDLAEPIVAHLTGTQFESQYWERDERARVEHDELAELLDRRAISLNLSGSVRQPKTMPGDHTVLLRHDNTGTPLAYSFPHGSGEFVYTVFHNHEQTSEVEEALFAFLLMVPIASVTDQTVTEAYTGLVAAETVDTEEVNQGRTESLDVVEPDTDDTTNDSTDDRAPRAPRTCSNCGQENDAGETFCSDCGYRLDT